MAKAALEALNGLDLFGVRGSQASVLHVLADEIARSRITLESLLPWESSSKEVDAAPAEHRRLPRLRRGGRGPGGADARRASSTRLQGRYGCKRFLRDGHQTAIEDAGRLHYEPWELKQFEHIECEWPLFFVYLMLDALFRGDADAVAGVPGAAGKACWWSGTGCCCCRNCTSSPPTAIDAERQQPHSQDAAAERQCPAGLGAEPVLSGADAGRGAAGAGRGGPAGPAPAARERPGSPSSRWRCWPRTRRCSWNWRRRGSPTQTPQQIEPIQVRRAGELAAAYSQIGRNDALGLTGRPVRRLRSLTTSKVFLIRGQPMVFLPSFLDPQKFYLMLDRHFLVAQVRSELAYIQRHWRQMGRPTMTLLLTRALLETGREALLDLIEELETGRMRRRSASGWAGSANCARRRAWSGSTTCTSSSSRRTRCGTRSRRSTAWPPTRRSPCRWAAAESRASSRKPTRPSLRPRLCASRNLYEQAEMLQALARLRGLEFPVTGPAARRRPCGTCWKTSTRRRRAARRAGPSGRRAPGGGPAATRRTSPSPTPSPTSWCARSRSRSASPIRTPR